VVLITDIEVYEKLKNCTDEIGKLGVYLQGISDFFSKKNVNKTKCDSAVLNHYQKIHYFSIFY